MDGIELMASAMHAAQARLDVSAANLANVSTDGFRRRVAHALFGERGLVTTSREDRTQGPLRRTGRALDLAAVGGAFVVRDASGATVAVRCGSFARDARGRLADDRGRVLLGAGGPVIASADATVDARGVVRDGGRAVATLRLRGDASVRSGFLEGANVDAVREMVDVLGAERAFETAQKTLGAIDDEREKLANDVARVK